MNTEIELNKVQSVCCEMNYNEQKLRVQYYELQELITSLRRIDEKGIQAACTKLQKQKTTLYNEIRKLQRMSNSLQKVVDTYRTYEDDIAEYDDSGYHRLINMKFVGIDISRYQILLKNNNVLFK